MSFGWGQGSSSARSATAWVMVALAVVGCGGSTGGGGGRDAGGQQVTPDGGVRVDSGTDAGTDAGPPDAGPPPVDDLRFVVLGDTGEGNAEQRAVAEQVRDLCAEEGCDLVVLLGDNIYDSGASSVTDPQWQSKFEEPYRDIDLPFYAVLGNHDYGGVLFGGTGDQWEKGPIEVEYTDHSARWEMPATHYTLRLGNVGFVMLDTNSILWDDTRYGDQAEWYPEAVDELRDDGAEWIIALGHHPYLSNGSHGNAGSYESLEIGGVELPNPLPILNGANVKSFFDDLICGTADIYMAGHDHNRQWIDEPDALCGTHLIVSGAGSKVTAFASTLSETLFADDTVPGFLYVVVEGDSFTGRFVDMSGNVDFEHTITRGAP